MKIKVLGNSGSDLPGKHLTSFLLDSYILFDAGGVTSSLNSKAQEKIKHIFITHAHLDHIRDIPFLADNIVVKGSKSQVIVYSIKEVIEDIKLHLLNQRIWPDFTLIPDESSSIIKLREIVEEETLNIDGYLITPIRVNHTVPSVGYLIKKDNKSLFYTGDTGPTKETWKRLGDIDLDALIIEASFPDKMENLAKITGHMTPKLIVEDLKFLYKTPKRIYITHIKPFYLRNILKDIQKHVKTEKYSFKILNGGETIRI